MHGAPTSTARWFTRIWANTYQREHPGVPVMWATALSLAIHDPAFGVEVAGPVDEDFVEVLAARGQNALELLGTARMVLVVFILMAVAGAFLFGADLLGLWAALVGFILLALDPFHIALSRLLIMDALVSVLMLLSVLALTRCLLADSWFACIVSAIAAGLAMLTKTPAIFLGPFALLLFGLAALWQRPPVHKISRRGLVARFLIWGTITVSIYFLLWPAMWVDPIGVLSKVWGESITYATGEHVSRTFFAGQIVAGDPGPTFYPLTLLWRTTPVVLAGLLLALVFVRQVKSNPTMAATCLVLGLFALFYGVLIATGQKKLDRYVLPLLPPLDLLAGVGWTATAVWIHRQARPMIGAGYAATLAVSIPVLALLVHAGGSLAVSPYF